jgi:hypothetical protein
MTTIKISALPEATDALANDDLLVIVRDTDTTTKKTTALHLKTYMNSPGVDVLASDGVVTLNFDPSLSPLKLLDMEHDIAFVSSNLAAGLILSVRLLATVSDRALEFPVAWVFIGAAPPALLAAGKSAILSLTSMTALDTGVIAAYSAEP